LLAFFEEQEMLIWLCVWSYCYSSKLFSCAEVNISDASVDALYFGSAILIDIIVI